MSTSVIIHQRSGDLRQDDISPLCLNAFSVRLCGKVLPVASLPKSPQQLQTVLTSLGLWKAHLFIHSFDCGRLAVMRFCLQSS